MFLNHKKRHTIPGLNTTSTADISFMLLIFFLVTTSMDSEKGLGRQLPPLEPDKQEQLQDIDKNKVITLHLMADDKLTVNDEPSLIDRSLRKQLRHFIIEKGREHVIELHVDREATYDSYFHLQNQIIRAYKEVRDAASQKKFGHPFLQLPEADRDQILHYYPLRIQEAAI
jgi:biopolymer transport protein ExbD